MTREEAIETVRRCCPHISDSECDFETAMRVLIPELTESEDERIRQSLLAYIKGESKRLDTKKWIAYLEKQKEPHFTKRNALFDKCVANCDPEILKKVSDEVDERLQKELKPAEYIKRNSKEWYSLLTEQYDKGFWKGKAEQKPAEWSEEDEDIRQSIIKDIKWERDNTPVTVDKDIRKYDEQINWLKSIRPQPKVEWSEEDEKMLKNVLFVLESYVSQSESASSPSLTVTYPTYYKEIDWLKSKLNGNTGK